MFAAGIFGVGFLIFTLMLKVAVPIMMGTFDIDSPLARLRPAEKEPLPAASPEEPEISSA